MKKMIIAVVVLVVMMAAAASAEVSGSVSTKMLTEYVSPVGFVFYDKPVQQSELFVALPAGFYADLWVSMPLDGRNNFGKEVDYTLGWSGEFAGTGLWLNAGVSYYDCINLFTSKGDVINPYAKLSKTVVIDEKQSITPFVKIELPFAVHNDFQIGSRAYLGASHSWKVAERAVFLTDVYVVRDGSKGFVGSLTETVSWKIAEKITAGASLTVLQPISSFSDGRKTQVVPAIGLTLNF